MIEHQCARAMRNSEHRRRHLLLGVLPIVIFLGSGCAHYEAEPTGEVRVGYSKKGKDVFFGFVDPSYDDKGPGRYTYPLVVQKDARTDGLNSANAANRVTHPLDAGGSPNFLLDQKNGFFDITNFEVISGDTNVIFEITTNRPIPKFREDGSSEPKGWFLQLMDIYIDKDGKDGSGRTRTIPGRNLEFAPENGWEKVVLVSPQQRFDLRRLIEQITWDLDFVEMRKDIIIPDVVFVESFRFRVFVPKSLIGEPQPHWGYQCFMMLYDPANLRYGHFQQGRVQRFAGNNVFGGGDEYQGHPNVIDILAPTAQVQYDIMSRFTSSPNRAENRFAVVPMIYSATRSPAQTGTSVLSHAPRARPQAVRPEASDASTRSIPRRLNSLPMADEHPEVAPLSRSVSRTRGYRAQPSGGRDPVIRGSAVIQRAGDPELGGIFSNDPLSGFNGNSNHAGGY